MGGQSRDGTSPRDSTVPQVPDPQSFANKFTLAGGKAKPLKSAKKAVKDLDDEDKAYQEKKRAGTQSLGPEPVPNLLPQRRRAANTDTNVPCRGEGSQGDGGERQGQGPPELGEPGHQEEREEISERRALGVRVRECDGRRDRTFNDACLQRPHVCIFSASFPLQRLHVGPESGGLRLSLRPRLHRSDGSFAGRRGRA